MQPDNPTIFITFFPFVKTDTKKYLSYPHSRLGLSLKHKSAHANPFVSYSDISISQKLSNLSMNHRKKSNFNFNLNLLLNDY